MAARKFFFVAAGMFLLALSYHFGASTAGAQATQFRVLDASQMYVETGGQIYYWDPSGFGGWRTPSSVPPAPASSILAGHAPYITTDGTLWAVDASGTSWTSHPLPSGPTSALHESWGQVKARYQNTPGTPVTPRADRR